MSRDPVEAIARAVLYQGYVLWPYSSAPKSRRRSSFGGLYPRRFASASRQGDRPGLRCECLIRGGRQARVGVEVRFLHLLHRQVLQRMGSADRPVDELRVDGQLYLTWDEAVECRTALPDAALGELATEPHSRALHFPGGSEREALRGAREERAGTLLRTWESLSATLTIAAVTLRRGLYRVGVEVVNESGWEGIQRGEAQRHALLCAHLILTTEGGAFLSANDPPRRFAEDAAGCRNDGVWPVLVGEPGAQDRLLAAPIILEDYPRVADESPGDLAEVGEVDRPPPLGDPPPTDPRARAILEGNDGREERLRRQDRALPDPRRLQAGVRS